MESGHLTFGFTFRERFKKQNPDIQHPNLIWRKLEKIEIQVLKIRIPYIDNLFHYIL